jgi:hypothetical protein
MEQQKRGTFPTRPDIFEHFRQNLEDVFLCENGGNPEKRKMTMPT